MPYIKEESRVELVEHERCPETAGELNYQLTMVCLNYVQDRGGPTYTTINEIVGALECCKLEFYRRLAVPYEDDKINKNGDVY